MGAELKMNDESPKSASGVNEPDLCEVGHESAVGMDVTDSDLVAAGVVARASRLASAGEGGVEAVEARRVLLEGAAGLIGADNLLWVFGRTGSTREDWRVVPMKMIKCGRVPMLRGAWHALRMMGAFGRPRETVGLHDLALAGRPFVRSVRQVLPEGVWERETGFVSYRRRVGMDDLLYAVVPRVEEGVMKISSVMFGRATGAAAFSRREMRLAAMMLFGASWFHPFRSGGWEERAGTNEHAAGWAKLSEKEQQLAVLLGSELKYAQIAAMTGVTESTIKTYAVRIFRALGVENRHALRDRIALTGLRLP